MRGVANAVNLVKTTNLDGVSICQNTLFLNVFDRGTVVENVLLH